MKHSTRVVFIGIIIFTVCIPFPSLSREVDMRNHWNDKIPLENPHKGWYHHYPDNHINKYIIEDDSHILDFPGMDHIYIRLAWAYLEPEEGNFNWDLIDSIIDKWRAHGLKVAFRISCKETSTDRIEQQYATPKWVMEAGAKGGFYRGGKKVGPDGPWEPVFDDPIFLEKLENFLRAFGNRYDGKPWVRYVDIGSIGDWGEGHLHSGSRLEYGYKERKLHVDLYRKYVPKTQLIISDDFVHAVKDNNKREMLHKHILEWDISYRDDSILVDSYVKNHFDSDTVRSPELFADSYRTMPNVLELQHYHAVKRDGNWLGRPGSSLRKRSKEKTGADVFRGALDVLHATYIGYHGDADDWFTDNPELTEELLNRCGYWYFIHNVEIPDTFQAGETHNISVTWENKGVAPAYHPYKLIIRFEGPATHEFELDAHNERWIPKEICKETYSISIPSALATGKYTLKMKLLSKQEERNVSLAFEPTITDKDGLYRIADIQVMKR